VFYGWWIVAAGFGLEMLIGGLIFHAYGAYVVLLREEFGWSKTMLSAAFSMARAESGILGPVQGWLTDCAGGGGGRCRERRFRQRGLCAAYAPPGRPRSGRSPSAPRASWARRPS
jgi:hypothetical protein